MPDFDDSLGGQTLGGYNNDDRFEKSLGDEHTMGGDTDVNSLGDERTLGDTNIEDDLLDDGIKLEDLSERYTEEGVLGKGGMGEVLLATDTRLDRKVAIKRILGKAACSKTASQRFLTEAKSIAALNHNNIVQIYDYGRSTEGPFLIMECVQGGSLLDKCKEGPIELEEAVNIFSQLCDGLAKAHAANIIHRDIKPANVLMTEDGVPKLTDFGLAKDDTADTGMTVTGAVMGTFDFMPPEQREGAHLTDHRSDLWSLAATFYQMLTGKSPKIIKFSAVPAKLQDFLGKALEDDKDDRYQSALEMREAFLQAHSGKMDTSRKLGEGECPECGTSNPPNGKFCVECGAKLQVPCLKCQHPIQIWNKACGECGARQRPLVDEKLDELQGFHDQAELHLQALEFDDALTAAERVGVQNDPRLQEYSSWHKDFTKRLQRDKEHELGRLEEFLREATILLQNDEFEKARSVLRKVDRNLHSIVIADVGSVVSVRQHITDKKKQLKRARGRFEEIKLRIDEFVETLNFSDALKLLNEIDLQQFAGLTEEVVGWIKNCRMSIEAKSREAHRIANVQIKTANDLIASHDYASALQILEEIPSQIESHTVAPLIGKCRSALRQLRVKQSQLKDLNPKDFSPEEAIALVEDIIDLGGENEELLALQRELEVKKKLFSALALQLDEAEVLVDNGNARGALKHLEVRDQTGLITPLRVRIYNIEECAYAEERLVSVIQDTKRDGILNHIDAWEVLDAVHDLLSLACYHANALSIQGQMIERISSDTERYHAALLRALNRGQIRNVEQLKNYIPSLSTTPAYQIITTGLKYMMQKAEQNGNIDLFITTNVLPPEAVMQLIEFDGENLIFRNLKALSRLTPKHLWRWQGSLEFERVSDLYLNVAKEMRQFSGKKLGFDGLRLLRGDVAVQIGRCRAKILSLSGLTNISEDVLLALSAFDGDLIQFNGIKTLTISQATGLSKFKVSNIELWGLESVDPEVANVLTNFKGNIHLNPRAFVN